MLTGSIVALVTPMHESGEVVWDALDELIEWHVQSGTHGIVPMGTTGESATLDTEEHLQVIKRTIDKLGRIPVIAGTGSNSTAEAIHQTQEAEAAGADARLLVTPYYNRPTQKGLFRHYEAIAAATSVPVVLYNVPPRTGCDLAAETVGRLSELTASWASRKPAGCVTGDLTFVMRWLPRVWTIFCPFRRRRANTANDELGCRRHDLCHRQRVARPDGEFCAAYLRGDTDQALAPDRKLQPVHDIIFVESSPTPTKWALADLGRMPGGIRLPLIPLSEEHHQEVCLRIQAAGNNQ